MSRLEPTESPLIRALIRALIRTLLALACTSAVLSASTMSDASTCVAPGSPARQFRPPDFRCDQITHLELDFLNDEVDVPEAFSVNAGAIPPGGTAEFRVYAATDYPGVYYDVTESLREIKFRDRGFSGADRIRYADDGENPRWVFEPRRPRMKGRTGTLECSFKCGSLPWRRYTTRFVLTALGYG